METSPLPVKDCKCWPMLGTHSHWAVRVLNSATTTVTRGIRLYCRAFSSGTATTCFYHLGLSRLEFEHPTFRLRYQRSNPLRHRRWSNDWLLNLPDVFNTVGKVLIRVSSTESFINLSRCGNLYTLHIERISYYSLYERLIRRFFVKLLFQNVCCRQLEWTLYCIYYFIKC